MTLTKLLVFIGIAFVLLRTPVIGKYISVINTLIHETGHALVAILTGGKVDKIKLFANTEGVAHTRNHWLGRLFTTLAGYPAASAASFLFLHLIRENRYDTVLLILSGILVVVTALWIRNIYGFLWLLSLGAGFAALHYYDKTALTENVLLAITAVVFVESVVSAFVIMLMSFRSPRDAGDASGMARNTWIVPPQVWGILFFLQSLFFARLGILLYL